MKKYWKKIAVFLLSLILTGMECVPAAAATLNTTPTEEESTVSAERTHQIYCTALGDSIAKGYSCKKSNWVECYGSLAAKKIAYSEKCRYIYRNFARTGLDTAGLNERYLTQDKVLVSLEKSDVIFITIGSNDLLNECKDVAAKILKTDTEFKSADQALAALKDAMKKNPLLVLNAINAIGNWDYHSFEKEWNKMMETINSVKQEDAQIIVTTIYNPVVNMKLPSTINQVVDEIIQNMNSIIIKRAGEYGYQVADLSDSSIAAHLQPDGIHPDQQGHQIIADLVYKKYK